MDMEKLQYNVLEKVNTPADLKKLNSEELKYLCDEIRAYIIDVLANNPGHLASSLGTVELTIALHYVFNTPDDKLIWDVGHQAYSHKIITGRKERFHTLRTYNGLSGFPKMDESEYDSFGTGHSSTSISAALGMAIASAIDGNTTRQHIAVIGDGSMTGGMAFEGLNHAGVSKANLLVILNDNGIAIDKSVGALSHYLTTITTSSAYNRLKNKIWDFYGEGNKGRKQKNFFRKIGISMKSALVKQSNLFEALNFRYFGPIDGHDVENLIKILGKLSKIQGPKLLHIVTRKGKGLKEAEKNPIVYHAPGLFDANTGKQVVADDNNKPLKYQDVFGHTIVELAEKNNKILGITPAMPTGCSLNIMMDKMPNRAFDVGIAEQHAVTFAAGLAAQGMRPFCNIYSSFMQRAYDQVIHDVALQKLPVVFCLDRGGLVGEDGATHHGVFDYAYFRPIPNLTIASPLDEHELRNMMYTAQMDGKGPFVIRYPRGGGVHVDWKNPFKEIEIGKGRCLKSGHNIALLSIGHIGNAAMQAAVIDENLGINVGVYDMRFLKPLDESLIHEVAETYSHIITIENGVLKGGFGSAVAEYVVDNKLPVTVYRMGIPDSFIPHGSLRELHKDCRIDTEAIVDKICELDKLIRER
ncbi:MAG: 1-deoxy-D-xylulose-5-phosphate synthase [Bacteroidales bacterium]|nr:1-deoxy-D-xylulose-5-phosphate synthase [Bacteroidales bacterium]